MPKRRSGATEAAKASAGSRRLEVIRRRGKAAAQRRRRRTLYAVLATACGLIAVVGLMIYVMSRPEPAGSEQVVGQPADGAAAEVEQPGVVPEPVPGSGTDVTAEPELQPVPESEAESGGLRNPFVRGSTPEGSSVESPGSAAADPSTP